MISRTFKDHNLGGQPGQLATGKLHKDKLSQPIERAENKLSAMLLNDKILELNDDGRVIVDQPTAEKAIIMSQHVLRHVSGVSTPLGIATTYHLFNQTRSKSLIMMNNRLGLGISYERMQRQLTAQSEKVMQQVETDGVYVPETMMKNSEIPHVFAMDNLDWKMKTLEGGSFNATTAIIIENQKIVRVQEGARFPLLPRTERRLSLMLLTYLLPCVTSPLKTGRGPDAEAGLPGFSAFCADLHPHRPASIIGYLPLIPASPTDPAVLKEEIKRLVKTSHALGDKYTIITGDQATYELAVAIRDKHRDEFCNVVLLLGDFTKLITT
ncbi:hypothetical protein F7725_022249 [Dissostichus mawsoni]|uniref:Uncharacterized protein n=1 Tax=Dissostichus mawsoni TaxID=36200 RepID=A0A7J5YX67_DISMA|nr:hypothetical protein F7725_022249 [Dissostichus mawsoni]